MSQQTWPKRADLVFPSSEHAAKELAMQLKDLGFTAAIFCYEEEAKLPGRMVLADLGRALKLDIKTAILLKDRKKVAAVKKKADFLIAPPLRDCFEDKRIDAIIGTGREPRKDSPHYRRSLTQVEANLAKAQGKIILFNLADALSLGARPGRQAELLGRWEQDRVILKKKHTPFAIVSGARAWRGLRSRKDLESFFKC